MEIQILPIPGPEGTGKVIVYRPLAGIAFVANQSMAQVALEASKGILAGDGKLVEAVQFLASIGFLEPDPPPPPEARAQFAPTTVVLLMTNQCQLRCIYCYASAGEFAPRHLSFDLARAAIDYVCDQAQKVGAPQFEVSFHGGGEPVMAWQALKESFAYARRLPLRAHITLTSNGVWSPVQRGWLLDHLDGLSLSLDGSPHTQDHQRPFLNGRGSAKVVMQTVAELDRRKFPYGIRMTATAPWTGFPQNVRFLCTETGCPSLQVEPAFNLSRGGHGRPEAVEAQAFARAYLDAYDIAVAHGRRLQYSGARVGTVTSTFCSAPYQALIVNGLGELVTCYEISGENHPLATISRIGNIVNGEVVLLPESRDYLHALIEARRSSCRDCFCYWSCAGGCYTRTFGEEAQGYLVHDARCELSRTLTRELLLREIAVADGVWRQGRTIQEDRVGMKGEGHHAG